MDDRNIINHESHFSQIPSAIDIQRSAFDRSSSHSTTMDIGRLIPIYIDEVLPGDTIDMTVSSIVRMATPIYPVIGSAFTDVRFFFVPNRIVWEHWNEFMGENNSTYWTQPIEYEVPQLRLPEDGFKVGTIADYFGIPINVGGSTVNALPFRALAKIYNDWYRDENLQQPISINTGDSEEQGVNADWDEHVTKGALGGYPYKVARLHDYFSSSLPSAQKGVAVALPIGGVAGTVPVFAMGSVNDNLPLGNRMYWTESNNSPVAGGTHIFGFHTLYDETDPNHPRNYSEVNYLNPTGATRTDANFVPSNLKADFNNLPVSNTATINELRTSFAIQRAFETFARGGTRYFELLKACFGVESPDARLQRSEYLGGYRNQVQMEQVSQTSSTNSISPLGTLGAYSQTNNVDSVFTKSFVEHGFVIGVACTRVLHTYQQGLERFFSRRKKFDFYWPQLANVGEQYIKNKEIYLQSDSVLDPDGDIYNEQPFGYQEAWAEYRYKPSRVSGKFRSGIDGGSLDSWHYADYYDSAPLLSSDWIVEPSENFKRTIAVQNEPDFLADFYFDAKYYRPMPLYSIPGNNPHF
ncbi:major capsid protein [Capybara microvirus Cap3_SP_588]|nr:major capsid protein [Capybara microvirus Cap3_SP_588]